MKLTNVLTILLTLILASCATSSLTPKSDVRIGGISVLPEQETFIEITSAEGKIISFKKVQENTNPENTIILKLTNTKNGAMLSAKNPFDFFLKYHIDMVDYSAKLHQTSSCPVAAKGGAYESWGHPIPELIISNIHTLDISNGFSCVY